MKIERLGDSLAFRIPDEFAELLELEAGCEVELAFRDSTLVVEIPRERKYTLEEFVSRITDENRHEEIDTGPSVGNEAW